MGKDKKKKKGGGPPKKAGGATGKVVKATRASSRLAAARAKEGSEAKPAPMADEQMLVEEPARQEPGEEKRAGQVPASKVAELRERKGRPPRPPRSYKDAVELTLAQANRRSSPPQRPLTAAEKATPVSKLAFRPASTRVRRPTGRTLIFDEVPSSWSRAQLVAAMAAALRRAGAVFEALYLDEYKVMPRGGRLVRFPAGEWAGWFLATDGRRPAVVQHRHGDANLDAEVAGGEGEAAWTCLPVQPPGTAARAAAQRRDREACSLFLFVGRADVEGWLSAVPVGERQKALGEFLQRHLQLPPGARVVPQRKLGAVLLVFSSTEDKRAFGFEARVREEGWRARCRDAVDDLPVCRACWAVGHTRSQCRYQPRCVCGDRGHMAKQGRCPKAASEAGRPCCLHCKSHRHVTGSDVCPAVRATRRGIREGTVTAHDGPTQAESDCVRETAMAAMEQAKKTGAPPRPLLEGKRGRTRTSHVVKDDEVDVVTVRLAQEVVTLQGRILELEGEVQRLLGILDEVAFASSPARSKRKAVASPEGSARVGKRSGVPSDPPE